MHYFDSSVGASLSCPGVFLSLSSAALHQKHSCMHDTTDSFCSRILLFIKPFFGGVENFVLHSPVFRGFACLMSCMTKWYIASLHNYVCLETDCSLFNSHALYPILLAAQC